MRRVFVLAAACVLLGACSTRALRASDDLWEGDRSPDGSAFMGYHGRVEQPAATPAD